MKKLDEILEFLFHTKRGLGITALTAAVASMTLTGCMPLSLAETILLEVCGGCELCEICGDCFGELNSTCNEQVFPEDCFLGGLCGGGCETQCGSCGNNYIMTCYGWDCDSCQEWRCEEIDGGSCAGGITYCGNCAVNCQDILLDRHRVNYDVYTDTGVLLAEDKYYSFEERTEYDGVSPYSPGEYYSFIGYFANYDRTTKQFTDQITDGDGRLLPGKSFMTINRMYGKAVEKCVGQNRTFNFKFEANGVAIDNTYDIPSNSLYYSFKDAEVTTNSSMANVGTYKVGSKMDWAPQAPSITGFTFKGWKLNGSTVNFRQGETFRLQTYSLGTKQTEFDVIAVYTTAQIKVNVVIDDYTGTFEVPWGTTVKELIDDNNLESLFPEAEEKQYRGWSYTATGKDIMGGDELNDPIQASVANSSGTFLVDLYARFANAVTVFVEDFWGKNTSQKDVLGKYVGEQFSFSSLGIEQKIVNSSGEHTFLGYEEWNGTAYVPISHQTFELTKESYRFRATWSFRACVSITILDYYGTDTSSKSYNGNFVGDLFKLQSSLSPDPQYEELYTFVKYVDVSDGTEQPVSSYNFTLENETYIFKAIWKAKQSFDIWYYDDPNSSDIVMYDTYYYSNTETHPLVTYKDVYGTDVPAGYNFEGWCTTPELTDTPMKELPAGTFGDKKLYAKIVPFALTLKFYAGDHGGAVPDNVSIPYDQEFSQLPVMTDEHYDFVGWKWTQENVMLTDANGNCVTVIDSTLFEYVNKTTLLIPVVAQWEKKAYTLTFCDEDGVAIPEGTLKVQDGAAGGAAPVSAPDKTGHYFVRWINTITGEEYNPEALVYGDAKYRAEYARQTYVITLDAGAGHTCSNGQQTMEIEVVYGQKVNLGVPTGNGIFFGWFTEQNGQGEQYGNDDGSMTRNYMVAGPITLYASYL